MAAAHRVVKVVPLPHARSEVWSYFGFIADDDGEIQDRKNAICKICATTLSYSGNTTNMFTHLKAMHPEATPQKLQPTNKFPRTGRKAPSKRKFLEAIANTGHLAIEYPVVTNSAAPVANDATPCSSSSSNSYIIRVHSTSNGTEHVFEETLSVSPEVTTAIHHPASPSSSSSTTTTSITSPSVICVNKASLSSSAGNRVAGSLTLSNANDIVSHHQQNNVCSVDDITNAIVDMIVKDCRPLCLVDGKGFQALLKLIAPDYQIPDHQRLESLVKSKYDDLRRELILKGMQGEA